MSKYHIILEENHLVISPHSSKIGKTRAVRPSWSQQREEKKVRGNKESFRSLHAPALPTRGLKTSADTLELQWWCRRKKEYCSYHTHTSEPSEEPAMPGVHSSAQDPPSPSPPPGYPTASRMPVPRRIGARRQPEHSRWCCSCYGRARRSTCRRRGRSRAGKWCR